MKKIIFYVVIGWALIAVVRAFMASQDVTNGFTFGQAFKKLIVNPFYSWN